ncbi:MAG: hypothetical protein CJD30_07765 [Sulfuricurvum sp. PD_MW2]|jgi:hypothetical protein|uniref:DUF2780 domain-containing protein n=1 Tax=Sulfuricurvum sp. PD_MW2 TaxID=2027917 RepID=UPI000C0677A1|nr:DUF2780 domain-containing protein [Sulfuricurvum sp. PD_MW2]PHM17176.1 MAG: hypothetical protein CJD30_07765 [Sulfuricurvum sp. PD_MW2]
MRSLFLAALLIISNANALDFGSVVQTLTPAAQSAAPALDASLTSNPLIKNLTSTLGITPTQAVGGTAAIINNAKNNMKPADFTALTKQVPQAGTLLGAAPAGLLGMGTLGSQFSFLGMDASMISKFTPLVLQYLQSGATPAMDKILAAAMAK